jgi:hypothetical protein
MGGFDAHSPLSLTAVIPNILPTLLIAIARWRESSDL